MVAALGLMVVLAGPAQANVAPSVAQPARVEAKAPVLVPLIVLTLRAAPVVVRAAKILKAARSAHKIRRAGRLVKARVGRGVAITSGRARVVRQHADRIAARGQTWARRNWARITPYARACFTAIVAGQSIEEFWDGVSAQEWLVFVSSPPLGVHWTEEYLDYLAIYQDPQFDFSKTRDVWIAACAAGMLEMKLKGV
ncbi:MAG: hypothetical protein ACRDKY_05435 [Solirubrobacteraceae bacterium]